MNYHTFASSSLVGEIGETIFHALAEATFGESRVSRVSKDRAYRRLGVDFVIDGVRYDVKTDLKASATNRMAIEVVSVDRPEADNTPGWAYTSQSDCFVYVFLDSPNQIWRLYFFSPRQISHLLRIYGGNVKTVKNQSYTSTVALVPFNSSHMRQKPFAKLPVVGGSYSEASKFLQLVHSWLSQHTAAAC